MCEKGPIVQVNSSTIPVAGLGLLAVAAVMAAVFPEARFILMAGPPSNRWNNSDPGKRVRSGYVHILDPRMR